MFINILFNTLIIVNPKKISKGITKHSLITLIQKETIKGMPYIIFNHNGDKNNVQKTSTDITDNIHKEKFLDSSVLILFFKYSMINLSSRRQHYEKEVLGVYISGHPLQEYEKFLEKGAVGLSDAELLAVILRSGSKEKSAVGLAQEILCREQKNLLNLHQLSMADMMEIPGIGQVKAIQLKCIAELGKRMAVTPYRRNLQVNDPGTIAGYYMEQMRHDTTEKLILAMFDAKNCFLGDEVLSVGTVNSSLVSPREIYLKSLQHQAVNIIILHNHPSGDSTPSEEDYRTTRRVAECGNMLGIYLADHIIIGDNNYTSLREKGILN